MHEPPQSHTASQQARIHYDSSTQESQHLSAYSETRPKPRSETTPPRTGAYRRFGRPPDTPAFEHLRTTSDTPISRSIRTTPHHAASRIGTVTPVFAPRRAEARKLSAPDRHRTSPGRSPRRYPTGAPPPGTPGRRFPRHPATPRIRPPEAPPRSQPPEDNRPKTTSRRRPRRHPPVRQNPAPRRNSRKKRAEQHAGKPSLR